MRKSLSTKTIFPYFDFVFLLVFLQNFAFPWLFSFINLGFRTFSGDLNILHVVYFSVFDHEARKVVLADFLGIDT